MNVEKINQLASEGIPFLVYTNFDASKCNVIPISELSQHDIEFSINDNYTPIEHTLSLHVKPVNQALYQKQFDKVIHHIKRGDTYLLNLTQESEVSVNADFNTIFTLANAPFKLRVKDDFVCFSPERFIKIADNSIETFPMKGTIDANEQSAYESLLHNKKEIAEHVMIVDLLRNDLSIVGTKTSVNTFRYIHKIQAGATELYQASSHISATLEPNWRRQLGTLLTKLLPAGSISGTPKKKTVELITSIEHFDRNYFCGIFGYFDGQNFDSAVMIRFLERQENRLVYKSGGGITADSDMSSEYYEMISKIYIP